MPVVTGTATYANNQPHVGRLLIIPITAPLFNGGALVLPTPIQVETDETGAFSQSLAYGFYAINLVISKNALNPVRQLRIRVPYTEDPEDVVQLEDILESELPSAQWFGQEVDPGGGGSVSAATASTLGTVVLDQNDGGSPVVVTRKTILGTIDLNVLFRPRAGEIYIKNRTSGDYHPLICDDVPGGGGVVGLTVDQTGIAFASIQEV